jgi:hypothetical protein
MDSMHCRSSLESHRDSLESGSAVPRHEVGDVRVRDPLQPSTISSAVIVVR